MKTKHTYPEGITREILHRIYDENGYSSHVENIKEDPTTEVNEYRITVSINWWEEGYTTDTIWGLEYGFKFCPTWVYKELVKRGLAPDIRREGVSCGAGIHSTDFNGKCFVCGKQVFVKSKKA